MFDLGASSAGKPSIIIINGVGAPAPSTNNPATDTRHPGQPSAAPDCKIVDRYLAHDEVTIHDH